MAEHVTARIEDTDGNTVVDAARLAIVMVPTGGGRRDWRGSTDAELQPGNYRLVLNDGREARIHVADMSGQFQGDGVYPA